MLTGDGLIKGDAKIFEEIVYRRRAIRSFRSDPLPEGALEHILYLTQRAPSGYNLQPWIAIVVDDSELKQKLQVAALGQPQIGEAPATVVFAADYRVTKRLPLALTLGKQTGHWNEEYAKKIEFSVKFGFAVGPLSLIGRAKSFLLRLVRIFVPVPNPPSTKSQLRGYVEKQTTFAIENFMLAAAAHGLDTCPMEGFDEKRVRKCLDLPSYYSIPAIVPIGVREKDVKLSPRFPASMTFFRNGLYPFLEDEKL